MSTGWPYRKPGVEASAHRTPPSLNKSSLYLPKHWLVQKTQLLRQMIRLHDMILGINVLSTGASCSPGPKAWCHRRPQSWRSRDAGSCLP